MRPIALIAADLGVLLAGQPAALELLRELLSADVHGRSMDASSDDLIEARRAADRARQKVKRDQLKAEKSAKQTMSGSSSDVQGSSMDASEDRGLSACNLLPSSFSIEHPERKEVAARARGIRLSKAAELSIENRYFAAAAGIPEDQIDRVWAEFIDFWIGVPGQRGCKLDWDATFRNRVRQLTPWKGKTNGQGPRTLATAGDDLIARAEEREQQERDRAFDQPH